MRGLVLSLICCLGAADGVAQGSVRFWGVQLSASDVPACVRFYAEGLGFEVERTVADGATVLRKGEFRLMCVVEEKPKDAPASQPGRPWSCGPYPNFRVPDLGVATEAAQRLGARLVDPEPVRNAIGHAQRLLDPAGNPLHLMQLDPQHGPAEDEPTVYNIGLRMRDLDGAESFFSELGFVVPTRAYLPRTLPLAMDGAAALVVHRREEDCATSRSRLVFSTDPGSGGDEDAQWSDGLFGRQRMVALPEVGDAVLFERAANDAAERKELPGAAGR